MSAAVVALINAHSRHGSDALGERIRAALPGARVAVTRSLEEARAFLLQAFTTHQRPVVLSGGGDGTAVSLLNTLRDEGLPYPTLGLLPLGTGNGWARAVGSVGPRAALESLAVLRSGTAPVLRRFGLVEVEGRVTPFAGCGWDAEILADYKRMVDDASGPIDPSAPPGARTGTKKGGALLPYLKSILTRSVPRLSKVDRPNVRLVNLGEPALKIDGSGRAVPVPNGGPGAVLYEGPYSVGGAGTTDQLGLGFKAFRFANLVPGRMAVRVYAAPPLEATLSIPMLWRGAHPLPYDHHYALTACRYEFDRPLALEIGGDVVGERSSVEFRLAPDTVPLVDWRRSLRAG
jgi:diacylglycerol kinase family enzyme